MLLQWAYKDSQLGAHTRTVGSTLNEPSVRGPSSVLSFGFVTAFWSGYSYIANKKELYWKVQAGISSIQSGRPPNVPALRAVWSLVDNISGLCEGSGLVLAYRVFSIRPV